MQKPSKMIIPELELLRSTQLDQTKKFVVADVGGEILEGMRQAPLSVNERSGCETWNSKQVTVASFYTGEKIYSRFIQEFSLGVI